MRYSTRHRNSISRTEDTAHTQQRSVVVCLKIVYSALLRTLFRRHRRSRILGDDRNAISEAGKRRGNTFKQYSRSLRGRERTIFTVIIKKNILKNPAAEDRARGKGEEQEEEEKEGREAAGGGGGKLE